MCFVAAFIKEYSLFYADMTCLGKKVETRVRLALRTGGGNTRSTQCVLFMDWTRSRQTRKEFTHAHMKYLQVIHAKKREVIHIIHKVIRF